MLSFMGPPVPPPPLVINPEAWSFFKLLDLDQRGDVEIEQFLMGCLRHGWVQTAGDVTTKFRLQPKSEKSQDLVVSVVLAGVDAFLFGGR